MWNFHDPTSDKSNRRLKDCFRQIPLKDREVFIIFDALEFKKPDVLQAKLALANMLLSAQAKPRLAHLSDDERVLAQEGDLGIDDYLALFGKDDFLAKVLPTAYRFGFCSESLRLQGELSPQQKEKVGNKLLGYYAVANEFQKIEIQKILVQRVQLSKTAIRRCDLKRSRERGSGPGGRGIRATTEDGKPIIDWKTERFWEEKIKDLVALLIAKRRSYLLGSIPVFIDDRGQYIHVTSPDVLSAQISEHAEINVRNDREGNRHYDALPRKDALILLSKPYFLKALPEIQATVDLPVYDRDFNLVQTGYNTADKIYLTGKSITPSVDIGTGHLDQILDGPRYADESSRVNRLGCLLAGLFPTLFMGNKPFILWQANSPGAGKSENALSDAIIRTGRICGNISYKPNDEELEKQIATEVSKGLQEVIIDNAKVENRAVVISSSVLERSVTSEVLNFRRLGSNTSITRPNSLFFVITANSPKLSGDLLSRSIPMSLYCEGDPDKVVYPMKSPHRWAKEHRLEIWTEMIGMVERWKRAGKPHANIEYRFREFAQIIGGILEVNGYRGFLGNIAEAKNMFSTEYEDLLDLFSAYPDLKGLPREFAEKAQLMGLFKGEFAGKKGSGLYRTMSHILSRYIGREFQTENGEVLTLRAAMDHRSGRRAFALFHGYHGSPRMDKSPSVEDNPHDSPTNSASSTDPRIKPGSPHMADSFFEKNFCEIFGEEHFIRGPVETSELLNDRREVSSTDEKTSSVVIRGSVEGGAENQGAEVSVDHGDIRSKCPPWSDLAPANGAR